MKLKPMFKWATTSLALLCLAMTWLLYTPILHAPTTDMDSVILAEQFGLRAANAWQGLGQDALWQAEPVIAKNAEITGTWLELNAWLAQNREILKDNYEIWSPGEGKLYIRIKRGRSPAILVTCKVNLVNDCIQIVLDKIQLGRIPLSRSWLTTQAKRILPQYPTEISKNRVTVDLSQLPFDAIHNAHITAFGYDKNEFWFTRHIYKKE